jgi:hypothetical protein
MVLYSLNNGGSWFDVAELYQGGSYPEFILTEESTQIKFKTNLLVNWSYCPSISSETLGLNLSSPGETQNFILTQNVLDILIDVGQVEGGRD